MFKQLPYILFNAVYLSGLRPNQQQVEYMSQGVRL